MREVVYSGQTPWCESEECRGIIKPDVVFFGQSLPQRFKDNAEIIEECDLLIILGTSLAVQPFASLTSRVKEATPRLYINLERSGNESTHPLMILMFGGGFDFDGTDNIRDVFWQGTCDDGCNALADHIGWGDELRQLVKDEHARLDIEMKAEERKSKPEPAKTAFMTQPSKSAVSSEATTPNALATSRQSIQGKAQQRATKGGKIKGKDKKKT